MSHDQEHVADPEAHREGYIRRNDYARAHLSNFSKMHARELYMMQHVSCCFLSTRGVAPTLLALKQHAQSLCYLISCLEPQTRPMQIDSKDSNNRIMRTTNPFDWMADMTRPYTNADPDHHRPLTDLMNQVKSSHDVLGVRYHCPLEEHAPREEGAPRKPYAAHANLLQHANECLERVDHEYSTSGGLLSVLPTDEDCDTDDLRSARNSLVGQWLTYTQQLVGRMHELEMAYGNALDVLAGEAVVPLQHMTVLGPDGRSGREVAYPQDRWVLANAGDDVFDLLHTMLDRAEALAEEKEKIWRADGGVVGERMWLDERGGKAYARGIIPINVSTRYYRLKGQGRNTIFVVPAWDLHPATQGTKDLEAKPTVVTVVAPRFPLRATDYEARHTARLERGSAAEIENLKMRDAVARKDRDIKLLADKGEWEKTRADDLYQTLSSLDDKDAVKLAQDLTQAQNEAKDKAQKLADANAKSTEAVKIAKEVAAKLQAELEEMTTAKAKLEAANQQLKVKNAELEGKIKVYAESAKAS